MDSVTLTWITRREYKRSNSRLRHTAYKEYHRSFPLTEEGLAAARKLAKQKETKGYGTRYFGRGVDPHTGKWVQ